MKNSGNKPGAHLIKQRLSDQLFEVFETAVRYQMYHALGLLAVGFVALRVDDAWIRSSGFSMFFGTLLFSGSLYFYVFFETKALVMVTPIGGLALIISWLCLTVAVGRMILHG